MTKRQSLIIILIILCIIIAAFSWTLYQNTKIPIEIIPNNDENIEQSPEDQQTPVEEKMGGTYSEAITAPPHLDPIRSNSEELTDITINIYESLYELDANYHPVPALATSCNISEDGKKYTFTIRRGVKFHDGSSMTAEDVLASFEYWLNYGNNDDIKDIIMGYGISEKNYLFYIELKEVYAPFLGRISNYVDNQRLVIMPKEVAVTGNEDTLIEIPCGTGPYKFTDWIPGKYCKLTRFDDYTPFTGVPSSGYSGQKTAYFKEVYFRFLSDSDARLSALRSGKIHYAGKITLDEYEVLADDTKLKAILGPLKKQNMFIFNCGIAPFNNVNARLAVMTGIDIDAIANIAVSNNSNYWSDEASIFGSSSSWNSPDSGEEIYNTHDMDKAKKYLELSGYDDIPVILMVNNKDLTQFLAAKVFQTQLDEIGFNTKLVSLDQGTLNNINSGLEGWNVYTTTFDTTYYDPLVYSTLINQNAWITHWDDNDAKIMNSIYNKMATETDPSKRLEIVKEWNDEFYRTAPAIKTFSYRSAYLFCNNFESTWMNELGVIPEGIAYNAWFGCTSDTNNQ